jgi:hypothetical protein
MLRNGSRAACGGRELTLGGRLGGAQIAPGVPLLPPGQILAPAWHHLQVNVTLTGADLKPAVNYTLFGEARTSE